MELKSLTQRIKCVGAESRCLSMLREYLMLSSMRLGVPFIAPRQLGAIGDQFGRHFLPSIEWCIVPLFMSGARSPSISGAADRCSSGPVGAPDTVRCTPDNLVCPTDRWSETRVARRLRSRLLAASAVGSPDSLVHHRIVRWVLATSPSSILETDEFVADDSPDILVHHRTVQWFIAVQLRRFPRAAGSPSASLGTGPSGVPGWAGVGCTLPILFHFFSSSFVTVSSTYTNTLVFKNNVLSLETYLVLWFALFTHCLAHKNLINRVGHLITKTL
jgi:hypothetical protein